MSMTCNKILYHGATVEVREPLTSVGRKDLDFGQGFYVTNDSYLVFVESFEAS